MMSAALSPVHITSMEHTRTQPTCNIDNELCACQTVEVLRTLQVSQPTTFPIKLMSEKRKGAGSSMNNKRGKGLTVECVFSYLS